MEAVGTMSLGRRQFGQEEQQVDSPNLRDFLRINENDSGRRNFAGQTLDSILSLERDRGPTRVRSNRTLLDIIRDDPIHNTSSDSRKSWRHRLRVCLQGSVPGSSSNNPIPESTRLNPSSSVGSDPSQAASSNSGTIRNAGGETTTAAVVMEVGTGEQPARMSLMALLEETDRHLGFDGSCFVMEVEEGRKEEEVAEPEKGGGEHSCCVCMVRNKGAAFIPCGHTFCRLCCRELWVQRGNCPLCNSLILEILDIF